MFAIVLDVRRCALDVRRCPRAFPPDAQASRTQIFRWTVLSERRATRVYLMSAIPFGECSRGRVGER